MATLDQKQDVEDAWQHRFDKLEEERDALQRRIAELENLQALQEDPAAVQIQRSEKFWQHEVIDKFKTDTDYVKSLIKKKQLQLETHVDKWKRNLLLVAAYYGSYEIVQYCVNLGADLNFKDKDNRSATDLARYNGYHHIEQLLIFSQMGMSVGGEVRNIADTIHKEEGINENMMIVLTEIGDETKDLFLNTLMQTMINIMYKKVTFSDHLLNLCWDIIAVRSTSNKDPLQSDLWKAIKTACCDVLQNGTKKDWHWLKTCVLPSTV